MNEPLTMISSIATRGVLAELAAHYEAGCGRRVSLESVGGVDAKKRIQAGEAFDVVALAQGAIDELVVSGHLLAGSKVDVARSRVAIAVHGGAPLPSIRTESELRDVALAASSIGYSTGPSGAAVRAAFERWGVLDAVRERVVVAPPGVSVGSLVASGEVELGFQQLSELVAVPGIAVLGPLPDPLHVTTTFAAGVGSSSRSPSAARSLLAFMISPAAVDAKRRYGMEPA